MRQIVEALAICHFVQQNCVANGIQPFHIFPVAAAAPIQHATHIADKSGSDSPAISDTIHAHLDKPIFRDLPMEQHRGVMIVRSRLEFHSSIVRPNGRLVNPKFVLLNRYYRPLFGGTHMSFITTPVIIAFAAGLIVGWNFFPQPAFVLDIVNKIKGMFKK